MNWIRSLLSPRESALYIDLGAANTLVVERERGVVANEPSVVAYRQGADGRRLTMAVGSEAKKKTGRTPQGLVTTHPLQDGVVADIEATKTLLRYFINAARSPFRWLRPRLLISLPYQVSDVERKAVRDCGVAAGAGDVDLIEEPMAAAIGAGLPVNSSRGSMIIDIGGGTTEIAVIALYGIVHCEAVRVGGRAFDLALVEFLRKKHNLIVGEPSAERLKIQVGSARPSRENAVALVRGVDFFSGLPREVRVSGLEVYEALQGLLGEIFAAARRTLEKTPPELLGDIIENGVVIAGGGALLKGMAERLAQELGIPARVAPDPLLALARGGQRSIRDAYLLSRILIA